MPGAQFVNHESITYFRESLLSGFFSFMNQIKLFENILL